MENKDRNPKEFIKVWFNLEDADWHNNENESLWCKVKQEEVLIDNIPLYAYGISYGDSIQYHLDENSLPVFHSVVKKSGNSTYRIISLDHFGDDCFNDLLTKLISIGCSYEGDGKSMVAVNVPSKVSISWAYKIFEEGFQKGIWDFEESDFNHSCAEKKI